MIGRWIDAQDDEVLGRLAKVPEDKWRWAMATLDSNGVGCLLAQGSPTGDWRYFDLPYDPATGISAIERQFDNLAYRFGNARVGRAISNRAARILRERNRVSLTLRICEHCGATVSADHVLYCSKVPVSVHVSLNCELVEAGA